MRKPLVIIAQILALVGLLIFLHVSATTAQSARTATVDTRLKEIENAFIEMKKEVSELKVSNAALVTQVNLLSSILGISSTLTTTYTVPQNLAVDAETTESIGDSDRDSGDDSSIFEILNVDGKVIESNDIWWKMAWVLEIKNTSNSTLDLNARIEFLDEDDFVIDDDYEYGIRIRPGETVKVNGYDLVDAGVAPEVVSISAEVFE